MESCSGIASSNGVMLVEILVRVLYLALIKIRKLVFVLILVDENICLFFRCYGDKQGKSSLDAIFWI